MHLLTLGGTRFLGRHVVEIALERGHQVTLFHRGSTGADLFPGCERILGDRDTDLARLDGRHFDAVVDLCGYLPEQVASAARALSGRADAYCFVSSLSALADKSIRDQLRQWEDAGYGHLPVCMAKTQYSFSTDPNLRGAPSGHSVPVREVRLSAGAGFIVAICGEIMTMPGLPRTPAAESIMMNESGEIEGLF